MRLEISLARQEVPQTSDNSIFASLGAGACIYLYNDQTIVVGAITHPQT